MGIRDKTMPSMKQLVEARKDNGFVFYVLWFSPSGLRIWGGPYQTEEMANSSTAMRDKTKKAFIIEAK